MIGWEVTQRCSKLRQEVTIGCYPMGKLGKRIAWGSNILGTPDSRLCLFSDTIFSHRKSSRKIDAGMVCVSPISNGTEKWNQELCAVSRGTIKIGHTGLWSLGMSKVEPHGAEKLDLLTKRLAHEIQHGIQKKWSCPKVNLMFLFPVFKLLRHARNPTWIPHPAPKPRHPKQAPATFPRPPGLPNKKNSGPWHLSGGYCPFWRNWTISSFKIPILQ